MKQPEIGELFVGAYLRIIQKCPLIQYNVMDDATGGQGEIDVLGINYETRRLYVCEVLTHLDGAQYVGRRDGKAYNATVDVLDKKFIHDRGFVQRAFAEFNEPVFMVWSPYVPIGQTTDDLNNMAAQWPGPGRLDLRINDRYAEAMNELAHEAAKETKQRGELFYRVLQLLTHLRGAGNKRLRLTLE